MTGGAGLVAGLVTHPAFAAYKTGPGGFSKNGLSKISAATQGFIDQGAAVGLVTLLYRHGEIAQVNTLGFQDREAKIPMKRDTIFRVASMSKPMTSVAALTLVEQGKMALTDPIEKWLPEFANPKVLNKPDSALNDVHAAPRGITVLDLLTHRSGLAYPFTAQGPLATALKPFMIEALGGPPTVDDWIKQLAALPLAFDPGTQWNYSFSDDVLGALIGRVSGQSFGDYLQSHLFGPLGMRDSGFWLPKEKQGRLAALYAEDETGKRVPVAHPAQEAPPKFASGGGGLLSTADDYLKFGRMLLGRGRLGDVRILSPVSVALMTTNWLTPEQRRTSGFTPNFWAGQGYGFGVSIVEDVALLGPGTQYGAKGAFGWGGAYGTMWQTDPAEDLVSIYMVQNTVPEGSVSPAKMAQVAANFYAPPTVLNELIHEAIDD
jgi:CubicO group peptidase (beta-lactamase class C family)